LELCAEAQEDEGNKTGFVHSGNANRESVFLFCIETINYGVSKEVAKLSESPFFFVLCQTVRYNVSVLVNVGHLGQYRLTKSQKLNRSKKSEVCTLALLWPKRRWM